MNKFRDSLRRTSVELVEATAKQLRTHRSSMFDNHMPFSSLRLLCALISYAMLLSDIPRSGLGESDFRTKHHLVEPDVVEHIGPWAYSVVSLNTTNATTEAAQLWPYKFDTTSIVWRAFAKLFNLTAFPPCVLYKSACPGDVIEGPTAFAMIDSMANAVATANSSYHSQSQRWQWPHQRVVAMRSEANYVDRLHHFMLPQFFLRPSWRTSQAWYFDPKLVSRRDFRLCGDMSRLLACNELWVNFRRSCSPKDRRCVSGVLLWDDVTRRLRVAQKAFPTLDVDLTVLESSEDMRVVFGGRSVSGRRLFDISTIVRARNCSKPGRPCQTVFLEDYRYEGGNSTSDVLLWFRVVASLRTIGQVYFWTRLVFLLGSCYVTRAAEEKYQHQSVLTKLRAALRVFVRLPSHAIIYGSPIPVVCYITAHLIDAPSTYETVSHQLDSQLGTVDIGFGDYATLTAIQMRNVWLLAITMHVVVSWSTIRAWSPALGVFGVPPYTLSTLSSLTILSQLRDLRFRDSRVFSIHPLVGTHPRSFALKNHFAFAQRGQGSMLLEGASIDFKFFSCVLLALAFLWCCWFGVCRICGVTTSYVEQSYPRYRTPVSYSAGKLWPVVAVGTKWRGSIFHKGRPLRESAWKYHRWTIFGAVGSRMSMFRPTQVAPAPQDSEKTKAVTPGEWPQSGRSSDVLRFVHDNLEHVHERCGDVDAIVAVMNLVFMSDPFVWIRLRFGRGIEVGFYQSRINSAKVVLLPVAVVED